MKLRAAIALVGALGAVTIACNDADGPVAMTGHDAGGVSLILGMADEATATLFTPIAPGATVRFAAGGQEAMLLFLAVRTFGMGEVVSGDLTIVNSTLGLTLHRHWDRLLLYCVGEGYCEQVPVYVPILEFGDPGLIDGSQVTMHATFMGGNGVAASFEVAAVLDSI